MARFKRITYLSYYSMKIFRILPSVVAFRISAASISFRGGFFNNCVNAALLLFSSASKSGLIPGCLCIMADSTKMDKSCKANYTNIQIFIFWRGFILFGLDLFISIFLPSLLSICLVFASLTGFVRRSTSLLTLYSF